MRLGILSGAIAFATLLHAGPALGASESLAAAIGSRNAELQALTARAAEARAKVGPAGSLPDPRVEVEVMDAMSFGGPRAALRQMLPVAGQPGLMSRMAEFEAEMQEAALADRRLMLLADGERALGELAYLSRVEDLTKTMREHAAHMSRVAEAKYAVGKGMQPDVLRAHVARTRLLAPSLGYVARRRTAQAQLTTLAPGWTAPVTTLTAGAPLPPPGTLLARAKSHSPMLQMKRLAIGHAETGLALARAERLPDLDFGVMAGRSMPGDMPYVGGMAMATVPLWFGSKQAPRIQAAESRLTAERAALQATERDVLARIEGALAQVEAAEQQLALYRGGLKVQARQAYRVSLGAYQVNQTDFLMVLDALMALYDAEMIEVMALTERRQMAAMALALAGTSPVEERPAP